MNLNEEQKEKNIQIQNTNLFARDIMGLKVQMDKREQQRSLALYYLSANKIQTALIYGRQLLFTSSKTQKQFEDYYQTEFQQRFFYRTSKQLEYLQYLLDCCLICKIYISAKKKEDLCEMLDKIELLDMERKQFYNIEQPQNGIKFNEYHQILSKTCAVLLTFIEISKLQRLTEYIEKFFHLYLNYVGKFYSSIQYATALFKYANYLYQSGQLPQAEIQYSKCMNIRYKNAINEAYIDVLVNYAVCVRQRCKLTDAIEKLKFAIEISKDIGIQKERLSDLYLFIGKVYLENAEFQLAYENMLKCYKMRLVYQRKSPIRVQIELNLLFLMKTLKDIDEDPDLMINLKAKKDIDLKKKKAKQVQARAKQDLINREDFAKFKEFKSSKTAHLNLVITKQFVDLLLSYQVQQLHQLLKKLGDVSFLRGLSQLHKCSFFKQYKTWIILKENNPHIAMKDL